MRKVSYQPRPHLVQVLRRYLLAGYDVELLSPRGNGGSRFLREFLAEVREHGQSAILLPDVGEERPVPSTLLAALTDQGRTVPNATASSPADLAGVLERAFGGRPLTLIVDGPQAIPPLLQAAIALYRTRAQLQIVLLRERASGALERAPQAVSVAMPTLTLEELSAVLSGVCGAPLDAATTARIYAKAAGLVKLAVAIAEIAMIEGNLKLVDGRWVAVRELWSARLLPMVRGYAQTAGTEHREALETLAVAGSVSVADAVALVGAAAVETLESLQLVSVEPAGRQHWVTVNPPILGEMLRYADGAARRERVGERVRRVTDKSLAISGSADREVRIGRVDPLLLRRVAERQDMLTREAQREWDDRPTPSAGLRYMRALLERGSPAEDVLRVVRGVSALQLSAEQRAALRIGEARVHAYQRRDWARGVALLETTEGEACDVGDYAGLLTAAKMRMCADLDVIPDDAEEQLAPRPAEPQEVREEKQRELLAVYYARGKLGLAGALIADIRQATEGPVSHRVRVYEALVQIGQGRPDDAVRLISRGFDGAKDELNGVAMRAYGYVLLLLALGRGQAMSVSRVHELCTALGDAPGFPQYAHLGIHGCGAASVSGSIEELTRLVRGVRAVPVAPGTLPGVGVAWAEAKLAAVAGDSAAAAEICWHDALELRRRGGYFAAMLSGLRSLDYGYSEARAQVLAVWVNAGDSEQCAALFAYLEARASGEATRIRAAIPRLSATGQVGHALQAFRELGRSVEARNDQELAAEISAEREAFSSALEVNGMDLLQMVASEAKLTRREEEVARLIAAGLTNRQIQDELVLSIRTVENHVHRLMRKLRVSTRQEVIDAVRDWAGDTAADPG